MFEAVFSVIGVPVGKERPRHRTVTTKAGKAFTQEYTPRKTRDYETLVAQEYAIQTGGRFAAREIALKLHITIYKPIPKSTSKKTAAAMQRGDILPGKKPDVDNVIKAVCDGLNGVAFEDDSQIVSIAADALYSTNPRVFVKIEEIGTNG